MPEACSTGSDQAWSLATGWLKKCLSSHVNCNQSFDEPVYYPTRLLDLGLCPENTSTLQLIVSAGSQLSGPYCTLSHCWGKVHLIQLNRDTAASLYSGLMVNQLPKTFQEAVEVTRRLGVRYLWIDSLCIIQDDHLDWLHEAQQMHKVYSHSYCNISASASSNSSQGLFRARKSDSLNPPRTRVCVDGLDSDKDFILCDIYDYHFWTNSVSRCTINKRAWV